jgi:hypothetical protein
VSISAFHSPEAQSNRTNIVTQRQQENPDLFTGRNLLHGWNDFFKNMFKEKNEKGGSITCAIFIDVDEWNQLHREFLVELQAKPKQFVSLNVLSNLRKLIFMDLLFLRGCDKYKKHQISQPNRSSPRGSVRPPNENGGQGNDDNTSGPRRLGTAARRRLDAAAACDGKTASDAADEGGGSAAAAAAAPSETASDAADDACDGAGGAGDEDDSGVVGGGGGDGGGGATAAVTSTGRAGPHIRLGPTFSRLSKFREVKISPGFRQAIPWLFCSSTTKNSRRSFPI